MSRRSKRPASRSSATAPCSPAPTASGCRRRAASSPPNTSSSRPAAIRIVPDIPGTRARHHLQRGVPSRDAAALDPDRGRRLYRGRVRDDLRRPRRRTPRIVYRGELHAARLRRGSARRARCRARGARHQAASTRPTSAACERQGDDVARALLRRRRRAVRRRDVRDRPPRQHRRPRPRSGRRRAQPRRRDRRSTNISQTNVPSIYAVGDVTGRAAADPGRHPRGLVRRRDAVQQQPAWRSTTR